MKKDTASNSAGIIAAHRAAESARPSDERVCYDPFAEQMLDPKFTVIGESDIPQEIALKLFKDLVPGFHEFFIARTRYMDDYLLTRLAGGLEQLVILGAGYDSRAYRFEELSRGVKVFEVDHPATQAKKKDKLQKIFTTLPSHVVFVPMDFSEENLEDRLAAFGYDRRLKTLFIWEGVTMYLDAAAVDKTLLFAAENSGSGSSIIFDFTYPDIIDGTNRRKEAVEWLKRANSKDEPILFGIGIDEVGAFLTERGFSQVSCVTDRFFNGAYFSDEEQPRKATPILAIAHGTVKS